MSSTTAVEVSASSPIGFDDAINRGIHQACLGLRDFLSLHNASVNDQQILLENGHPPSYRVTMQVTFMRGSEP